MRELPVSEIVTLGRQGRLVIPVRLRRSLGWKEGEHLVAREDEGRLVVEKPEEIKQRLRARFAHMPAEPKLADELIAERREEGQQESEA